VFVTQPADFTKIRHYVRCFELAKGARLNALKSKALAVGTWTAQPTILGIDFKERVNILGVTFRHTIAHSISDSWSTVIFAVRAQARKAYTRIMCLAQRIEYVQMCLLAKIWYIAQIFPPSRIHTQQLTTICAWFIWQGATFRIPMTTLKLSKYEGGWDFPNNELKCKTLFHNRLHMLATMGSSITSELMWQWDLTGFLPNPPPHFNLSDLSSSVRDRHGIHPPLCPQ
jgi:hypothetical protein